MGTEKSSVGRSQLEAKELLPVVIVVLAQLIICYLVPLTVKFGALEFRV